VIKKVVAIIVFALVVVGTIAGSYPQTVMLKVPGDPGNRVIEIKGTEVYYAMPYEEFGIGGGVITLWNILTGSSGAPQWW
jgi:hypothetical protein